MLKRGKGGEQVVSEVGMGQPGLWLHGRAACYMTRQERRGWLFLFSWGKPLACYRVWRAMMMSRALSHGHTNNLWSGTRLALEREMRFEGGG